MSRNAFAQCEREYNEREERLVEARARIREHLEHHLSRAKVLSVVHLENYRVFRRPSYLNRAIEMTRVALQCNRDLRRLSCCS